MADTKMNSDGLGEYLTRAFNGHKVTQRPDGFIHATEMCKVKKGKLFADWRRNKQSQEYIKELSDHMGIPICDLIENSQIRSDLGGGTWMHPKVALYLAMWISPSFAIVVMDWTSRFIAGDLTLVHDLVDRHETVSHRDHRRSRHRPRRT